ncbi:MAG: type II toxin-antitoxin system VapC family toxin [Acetobacteraceae bacterium]|nr:type II toxin-antitoxin system VapC family toxin [Acetobacteraceae bacterium]
MFLLDTNIVSVLRRLERAGAGRRDWAARTPAEQTFLSAVTVLELERGVLLVERRDPAQEAVLRRWLEGDVLARFARRVLAVDSAVAWRCAALHVPEPRPERDALIAATGFVHGLTVVTRSLADLAPMGVPLLDPGADVQA